MARSAFFFLTALAALAAAGGAGSQSLKSLRAQESEETALDHQVAYTNSVCGTNIASSIDWPSTASWPENESLVEACDGALGALEAICRADDGKKRAQKLTAFVCAGDGAGPSLHGSTFRYGASPGEDAFSDAMPYIKDAL
ncbi:MAG TPA: hypothetical protein VNH64_06245 [Parvularculaceae bacterium]|nr:hypothetical protein [Parvularculaceae bacterium]